VPREAKFAKQLQQGRGPPITKRAGPKESTGKIPTGLSRGNRPAALARTRKRIIQRVAPWPLYDPSWRSRIKGLKCPRSSPPHPPVENFWPRQEGVTNHQGFDNCLGRVPHQSADLFFFRDVPRTIKLDTYTQTTAAAGLPKAGYRKLRRPKKKAPATIRRIHRVLYKTSLVDRGVTIRALYDLVGERTDALTYTGGRPKPVVDVNSEFPTQRVGTENARASKTIQNDGEG